MRIRKIVYKEAQGGQSPEDTAVALFNSIVNLSHDEILRILNRLIDMVNTAVEQGRIRSNVRPSLAQAGTNPRPRLKLTIGTATIDDKGNASVTCDVCGEPIIGSDEFGMFCKNRCMNKKNRESKGILDKLIQGFLDEHENES